ncbi:hypothetical protein ACQ4WX_36840 [Streptomyces lasalocidi]
MPVREPPHHRAADHLAEGERPAASPAADRELLVRATSSTLPNRMVAVGSRPRNDTHGSSGTLRPIT